MQQPWNGPLLGVGWSFLPQILLEFVEIWTRGSPSWDKVSVWTMFQNIEFKHKWDVPKVFIFWPFLGPIYPRKTNYFDKNQIFPRNYNLSTIRWHKSQVPDKSENSYKNYQRYPFLGPKMGPNCPLGTPQGLHTISHIAYNRDIYPHFLDPQLLTSGYLSFWTIPWRYPYFRGLEAQLGPIWGFSSNNSSK